MHSIDKHRESNSLIFSASVNQYMPEHWHHYKVRPLTRCSMQLYPVGLQYVQTPLRSRLCVSHKL
jgi:hypothetical protein